jgi:hypothetical protein
MVALEPEPDLDTALATRLDVNERLIELLRLRAGRVENRLTMHKFLEQGITVSARGPFDPPLMTFGNTTLNRELGSGRYRRQSELQSALLLQLLHARSDRGRIGDDLHRFILAVSADLVPADTETTRTGVTRIATTTRDAARALRWYGLLRDSDATRTRKWELSLLGILTAVRLSRRTPTMGLPPHNAFGYSNGRFADSDRLSQDVEEALRAFRDDDEVKAALYPLCARDHDIFSNFNEVVATLARYCETLDAQWRALDDKRRTRTPAEVRAAADDMLRTVEDAVPPGALAEEVNKSLAFDQLSSLGRTDQA